MENKTKITTIIFDLGEVILTNDWTFYCPEKDKEFDDYYHIPGFIYKKTRLFNEFHTGKISETEFWKISLEEAGAKTTDSKKAIEIARKYQREKEPEMSDLLKNLKQNGYKLGVISTSSKEMIDWKIKNFKLRSYFDCIIDSGYSGLIKPDPKIYQLALDKFKVKPEETVFIDDTPKNVEAANNLGINGLLFGKRDNLIKDLQKLGMQI